MGKFSLLVGPFFNFGNRTWTNFFASNGHVYHSKGWYLCSL